MYQKIGSKGIENKLLQQSRHCMTSGDATTSITTSITIATATTAIG